MADTKKTPVFDWATGQFALGVGGTVKTATDAEAVAMIAQKALNTQLGKYSVYADYEDFSKNHIYGSRVHDIAVRRGLPEAVRLSEIERETKEALRYDPRIKEVTSVSVYTGYENGEQCIYTDIELVTVYNKQVELKGVRVNG